MSGTSFQVRHPGLVWSVSQPDAAVLIRAALLAPRFLTLLDACLEFGPDRVQAEWAVLVHAGSAEARRAAREVERMLRHIEAGFADAQA